MTFGIRQAHHSTNTRSRRLRSLLLLLLLVPMMSGLLGVAPAGQVAGDELEDAHAQQKALEEQIKAQEAQVAELEALQEELQGEIAQTASALAGINADLDAVRLSIAKMVEQIAQVQAKYDSLVIELATLDAKLVDLEEQEAAKRQELRERKAMLADRLRAAYDTDRISLLETFLSGGSFADVLSAVTYQLDIGAQDQALADQIKRDQETIAAIHASVEATRAQTNVLRQETAVKKKQLDAQLAALEDAQAQLRELEAETEEALNQQRAAFEQAAENKEQLEAAIRNAAVAQAELSGKIKELIRLESIGGRIPSEYNGMLVWPMEGNVTQPFGCTGFEWEPPKGDCAHFHSGIDVAAPMYTEIKSAGPGTVVFAGPNPYDSFPKAWIVIVAHSENLQTWYGHVDNAVKPPAVVAGQQVKAGDVLAYNGTTGRSTGPHLHWMVQLNGEFVNPRLFL